MQRAPCIMKACIETRATILTHEHLLKAGNLQGKALIVCLGVVPWKSPWNSIVCFRSSAFIDGSLKFLALKRNMVPNMCAIISEV